MPRLLTRINNSVQFLSVPNIVRVDTKKTRKTDDDARGKVRKNQASSSRDIVEIFQTTAAG